MPTYKPTQQESVDAGALRDRIAVYESVVTTTKGERTVTPTLRSGHSSVPAVVVVETASERVRAGRIESPSTIRVTVRTGWTIAATDTVTWNGVRYTVVEAPAPIDTRRLWYRFIAARTDANA